MINGKTTVYKGKKYVLTGGCHRCGKCCSCNMLYTLTGNDDRVDKVELGNPNFDGVCIKLDKVTKMCKIQKRKPHLCKNFPTLYEELALLPDCGYKWEYLEDCDEPDTNYNWAIIKKQGGYK